MSRPFAAFVLLSLLAFARPAAAQLGADEMRVFGGAWRSDCAKPAAAHVTLNANSIVLEDGAKRVVTKTAVQAASYYGMSPPGENYNTTFLGDLPDGDPLIVNLWQDGADSWLTLDGGAKVRALLGKDATVRFHQCKSAKPEVKAAEVPGPHVDPSKATLPGAAALAADPAFAKPYRKALGKFAKEDWLLTLEGPSPDVRQVTVAGDDYLLVHSCKAHDCADNNTTLLWSKARQLVYGKVRLAGKSALIGNPPPAVAKDLGEFWRQEFAKPASD